MNTPTKIATVFGPTGDVLTLADLPEPEEHWTPLRKATVILAVESGLLTLEKARERYTLTLEEFLSWKASYERSGLNGLKVGRTRMRRG